MRRWYRRRPPTRCWRWARRRHGIRLAGWDPLRTWRKPIVAILHLAYAFLPIGFPLIAGAALGWLDRSTALHALTVGVIGCAIVAMMTRTALGQHRAGGWKPAIWNTWPTPALVLSALVQVALPVWLPALKARAVAGAGARSGGGLPALPRQIHALPVASAHRRQGRLMRGSRCT